jgi:hypothetical protein
LAGHGWNPPETKKPAGADAEQLADPGKENVPPAQAVQVPVPVPNVLAAHWAHAPPTTPYPANVHRRMAIPKGVSNDEVNAVGPSVPVCAPSPASITRFPLDIKTL